MSVHRWSDGIVALRTIGGMPSTYPRMDVALRGPALASYSRPRVITAWVRPAMDRDAPVDKRSACPQVLGQRKAVAHTAHSPATVPDFLISFPRTRTAALTATLTLPVAVPRGGHPMLCHLCARFAAPPMFPVAHGLASYLMHHAPRHRSDCSRNLEPRFDIVTPRRPTFFGTSFGAAT